MFEEINPLPRSQRELTVNHGNRELNLCERGPKVRGHIVRPFIVVGVEARVFWRDSFEECFQIRTYFRRRILLDQ